MRKTPARILKASNVKLEGQFRLGADHAKPGLSNEKSVSPGKPQVCILEKNPEFSIVEITCSCGTKTCLRCEYANVGPSAENSQAQNSAPEVPDDAPDQAK